MSFRHVVFLFLLSLSLFSLLIPSTVEYLSLVHFSKANNPCISLRSELHPVPQSVRAILTHFTVFRISSLVSVRLILSLSLSLSLFLLGIPLYTLRIKHNQKQTNKHAHTIKSLAFFFLLFGFLSFCVYKT